MAWKDLQQGILGEFSDAQDRVDQAWGYNEFGVRDDAREVFLHSLNLCCKCAKQLPLERHGKWLCVDCQKRGDVAELARRHAQVAAGKCITCGEPTKAKGGWLCSEHTQRSTKKRGEHRASLIKSGRCRDCSAQIDGAARAGRCGKCHARQVESNTARKNRLVREGRCSDCGKASDQPGRRACRGCADKRLARYHARKVKAASTLTGTRPSI